MYVKFCNPRNKTMEIIQILVVTVFYLGHPVPYKNFTEINKHLLFKQFFLNIVFSPLAFFFCFHFFSKTFCVSQWTRITLN